MTGLPDQFIKNPEISTERLEPVEISVFIPKIRMSDLSLIVTSMRNHIEQELKDSGYGNTNKKDISVWQIDYREERPRE